MATAQPPMTAEQFDLLPEEDGRRYELLDGELIEMSRPTVEHNYIVTTLLLSLRPWLEARASGSGVPDVEFAFGESRRLCPDVAVLLGGKWSQLDRRKSPVMAIPDAVFEVVSASESASHVDRKVKACLEAGVSEVVIVYPDTAHAYVVSKSGAAHYWTEDTLTLATLSGWSLPLATLFASK